MPGLLTGSTNRTSRAVPIPPEPDVLDHATRWLNDQAHSAESAGTREQLVLERVARLLFVSAAAWA